MNERERADQLARAIDDLIRGDASAPPPQSLEDDDVQTLMRVAKARLRSARSSAKMAGQYEGAIWRQILTRLERQRQLETRQSEMLDPLLAGERPPAGAGREADELREIISLRREMGEQLAEFAEAHKADVWTQVQARIQSRQRKPAFLLPFDRRDRRERTGGAQRAPAQWPRFAAMAAGLGLLIAAVGPIPTTGLADHPAGGIINFVGDFVGVSETGSAPSPATQPFVRDGTAVTAEQASEALGLPLTEPGLLPEGMERGAALLFSEGITSNAGVFVLSHSSADGSARLTVYQEAAGGDLLAVAPDSAGSFDLADGSPATYFEGAWQPGGEMLSWSSSGGQTLVFERSGVRVVLAYAGPALQVSDLLDVANSMQPPSGD